MERTAFTYEELRTYEAVRDYIRTRYGDENAFLNYIRR